MKTSMRILGTIGLAALFALGACKKTESTTKEGEGKGTDKGGGSDLVKAYNDLADEVCACKDTKCVNDVQTKATDLAGKMSGTTPSEADQKAISDATAKWAKCAEEIAKNEAGAGTGGTAAGGAGEAVKAYQDLADAVCACKDAQCIADAQSKASDLGSKMSGMTPTAEEAQAISAAGEKMAKCVQDITAAGGAGGGTAGGGTAAAGGADEFVKAYNALADEVCGCKDAACLTGAMQKAQDLGTKASEVAASMTPEQGQAVAAASQKMSDCASKITGAGGAPQ